MTSDIKNEKLLKMATYVSVGVASLLIVIKLVSYIMTSSTSLLSSMIDSSLDVLASTVNMYAIHVSVKPADYNHKFGHGKAEPIAGLFHSSFIFGTAVFLMFESFSKFIHPNTVTNIDVGIYVMIISIILTLFVIIFQQFVVSKTSSVVIKADMTQYTGDILTNLGVISSLLIYKFLNFSYIDPIFSLGVSIYLLVTAYKIARTAISLLMDEELPKEVTDNIITASLKVPEVINVKNIKTRSSGNKYFFQLYIELDGNITLEKSHNIGVMVKNEIRQIYPDADIIIHENPAL